MRDTANPRSYLVTMVTADEDGLTCASSLFPIYLDLVSCNSRVMRLSSAGEQMESTRQNDAPVTPHSSPPPRRKRGDQARKSKLRLALRYARESLMSHREAL